MTAHTQTCANCKSKVEGQVYHLGFSNMEAVYCSDCPQVLFIKDQDYFEKNGVEFPSLTPGDKGWMEYNKHLLPYYERAEKLFPRCSCGGHFRFMAPPRCPKCFEYILGSGYDGKPYYRSRGYAFVTTGSISLGKTNGSESLK